MKQYRVIRQKIVSPDGRAIAAATSSVVTLNSDTTKTRQSITLRINQNSCSSSSHSSVHAH
ncbi:MAG: hypothetical protein AAFQ80_07255 [Cyanobacteria bacterium J06621_8]